MGVGGEVGVGMNGACGSMSWGWECEREWGAYGNGR